MLKIYDYPITAIAGKQVALQSTVTWREYHIYDWDTGQIDEDTVLVRNLAVLWREADQYIPPRYHNEERGNIFIESLDIYKEFDEKGIQAYYFRGIKLSQETAYILVGVFEYRDWISPPPLDNPAFIEQSNNPLYWRQTFEFQVIDMFKIHE